MQNDGNNLSARLLEFAASNVKLTAKLDINAVGRHIGNQLMRAATSSGANYEEACAAESRADFIHKMQIVLKELRECYYWLKLLNKLAVPAADELRPLLEESNELVKIFAKSVVTAKGNG